MGSVIKHNGELLYTLATIAHIPIHMCIHSIESINWRCSGKGTYFEGGACCMVMDAMACTINIFFFFQILMSILRRTCLCQKSNLWILWCMYLDVAQYQKKIESPLQQCQHKPFLGCQNEALTPFKCCNESDWDVTSHKSQ